MGLAQPDDLHINSAVGTTEVAAAGFSNLIDLMAPIRDGGSALADRLKAAAAMSNREAFDLSPVAASTRDAFAPLADALAAADRQTQARAAHSTLMNLRRRGVTLTAIASMTMITARSFGLTTFDSYVIELRRISGELVSASEVVLAAIDRVVHHDAAGVAAATAAVEALDSLLGQANAFSGAARSGETARQADAADALGAAARGLQARLTEELGGLIPVMQFADEFSQRMDHIERIGAKGGLEAIEAAQLDALAEDTEERLRAARTRMETLAGLSDRAAAHFERSGAAGQLSLHAEEHRSDLDGAVNEAASVARAAATAQQGFDVLGAAMQDAEDAFVSLEKQAADIRFAAVNSVLLSKSCGAASSALSALAATVSEQSRATVGDLNACRKALQATVRRDDDGGKRVAKSAADLTEALDRARQDLKDQESSVVEREAMTAAARLNAAEVSEAVAAAITAISDLVGCPHDLRAWAASTRGECIPPDPAVADAIIALYTMQRERDVHEIALGRPVSQAERTDASGEVDDVFF